MPDLSKKTRKYIASEMGKFLDLYTSINVSSLTTYEQREEAIKQVRDCLKEIKHGENDYFDEEILERELPIIKQMRKSEKARTSKDLSMYYS